MLILVTLTTLPQYRVFNKLRCENSIMICLLKLLILLLLKIIYMISKCVIHLRLAIIIFNLGNNSCFIFRMKKRF